MSAAITALREASDRFHAILGALVARRLLDGGRLTPKMREQFETQAQVDIEKLAADGFEQCVIALAALGDPSASIIDCNPTEEP